MRKTKSDAKGHRASGKAHHLRAKAHRSLAKKTGVLGKIGPKHMRGLLVELPVRQVEPGTGKEELRRAREKIEESRSRFVDLFDFAPIPYFTFDRNGTILELNFKGAELLGLERQALIDRPFSHFVFPGDRDTFRKHRHDTLRRTSRQKCELRVVRKDGTVSDVTMESISGKDSKGDVTQVRSALWDVTELRESKEKIRAEQAFRETIENSIRLGLAAFDYEGRHIYANPTFCRMVGWSQGELIGAKPPFLYWPEEERGAITDAFLEVLSRQKPARHQYELRFQHRNGRRFDGLVIFSELVDMEGKSLGWLASVGDITERKKQEEEIRRLNAELEEKVRQRTAELGAVNNDLQEAKELAERESSYLKTILETIPAAVVIAEGPPVRMRFMNRQGLDFHGGKDSQLEPPVVMSAEKVPIFRLDGTRLRVEEYPVVRALLKGEEVRGAEIVTGSPGERVIAVSASPLRDKEGNILAGIDTAIDITERKQAEEALREGEERLRFALETSHTGAWDLDLVDHSAHRSLEHDRIFGYEQLLPQWTYETFLEHVLPEDRAAVDAKFQQAVESQGNWSFECRIRRCDGEIRWIWAAGRHRTDTAGRFRRMAGIVQDITERKEAENQIRKLIEELTHKNLHLEAANQELDAYTSTVSHDLKNPLVVMGNVTGRLIKRYEEELDAKGKEYLQTLYSTCGRMSELVDDLLELSRISKVSLKFGEVDLSDRADSLFAEYREKDPARKVESAVAPGAVCRGDRQLLHSLLDNLLTNAWKFTRDCDPARIEFGIFREGPDLAYFVRDNGCGFDVPLDMTQVFLPFKRYHDPAEYPGTGIGLATVNRIISRHGGKVWLESEVGKGTAVYFTLPGR